MAPPPVRDARAPPPHVVVLTSPGAGHVVPVAELASRLAANHGVTSTVVTFANLSSPAHSSPLASLPPGVRTVELPAVPLDDLPSDAHLVTRILTVVRRTLPHLRDLLRSLMDEGVVTAFLTDMLCPAALAVAEDLGVPRFVFYTSSLMSLVSLLHAPELARATTCECRDLPEPVRLPGCPPLRGDDLFEPLQDRAKPVYDLVVGLGIDYLRADGFVVNTFDAMEHETLVAFQEFFSGEGGGVHPPAYAVGPFVRSACTDQEEEAAEHYECVRWLDAQPDGSVLYVCFGSGGTLSMEQNAELAAGLEASGHRFLWVVRHPSDKDCSASYFGRTSAGHSDDDPLSYLPEGFIERTKTKHVGLCVPPWAPQVEILNHRAVGGFLSHAGWNSTLEAAAAGVPVLAWPLFAEQRMNAVKLSSSESEGGVGVALRVRPREEDGMVPREDVSTLVREIMAGEKGAKARKKAVELREEAEKAAAPGGPAHRALAAVVANWIAQRELVREDPILSYA
ncbi:hypothetical protein PR202_gb05513 [Eleusine coracana subsp. coracana]|uniref:Glycosyltransferase n=1 Tax=Eleusine coracana subsp. coracana TaxID=191504 RepID=A0AAV5E778_ELECO|nr:hypothetical protein QOZ80_1BG0075510 [Eleusine coracana subsp. coracana]GJN18360.1 hypothetical protein PR202_gb05513 [Eleusine coracana subsp. coracana]